MAHAARNVHKIAFVVVPHLTESSCGGFEQIEKYLLHRMAARYQIGNLTRGAQRALSENELRKNGNIFGARTQNDRFAGPGDLKASIKSAEAEADRIQSILNDLILTSPRLGRVSFQLARAGEVIAASAPIPTILDLTDVYMTNFLLEADAARLHIGGKARIILDAAPTLVIPATVSFVGADAQFTPKTVETKDERAKLMFRVKLGIDPQILRDSCKRVKTGVRGMGFVRTKVSRWAKSARSSVPVKRRRNVVTAALIVGGPTQGSLKCNWNRREVLGHDPELLFLGTTPTTARLYDRKPLDTMRLIINIDSIFSKQKIN